MDGKQIVENAAHVVSNLTPSVVAVALAMGVAPKKLAAAYGDKEGQANFLIDFQAELARVQLAEEKERKEQSNK